MKTLVGYDGSEAAQRALLLAGELAGESGGIGVVHVASASGQAGDGTDEQEALLADARRIVGEHGRSATTLRHQGDTAAELVEAARQVESDLLLLGSRGRGLVSSAVLGSVSTAVAASADCPVVIVTPGARLSGDCVIAAVDGSEGSAEAVRVAGSISRRLGVPFLLAHAWVSLPIPGSAIVPGGRRELVELDRDEAVALLAEVAAEHGIDAGATRLVSGANQADAIESIATRENARMIVAASRGRAAVKSALLGSFSAALAAKSSCPVIVVPPGARIDHLDS
jgi:nucleotide-binding universal stress UspA family protein